mmetsp:Transcript_56416/g.93930  ORF Transcript_56416/g.93930 Transcript_56416/m.93930 type:complete len:89 (-) Transcript_56416:656-922(-)
MEKNKNKNNTKKENNRNTHANNRNTERSKFKQAKRKNTEKNWFIQISLYFLVLFEEAQMVAEFRIATKTYDLKKKKTKAKKGREKKQW